MNWIQVLLIVAIVTLLVYLLRSRRNAQSKAWVKVGYVLFVLAAVFWQTAAYRPAEDPVFTQRMNDLGWFMFLISVPVVNVQAFALKGPEHPPRSSRLRRAHRPVASVSALKPLGRYWFSRKNSTVRAMPSASCTRGAHPSTLLARPLSRQDRLRSPSRDGASSGSSGVPAAVAMAVCS